MKARNYILLGILLLALGLRIVRISWPEKPVFDEAHFATYAADYVKDQTFYDIHPPLGKLIYSAVLSVASEGRLSGNTDFIVFNASGTQPLVRSVGAPFGTFPYVPLRAVSGAFGVLLVAAFYLFLKNIGVGETGALLGALFAAVDNALVLQTKLIFMDGMYLAFGFLALALYFRRPRMPIAAGMLLGLSFGVKLIGVIFLGPILIDYFISRPAKLRQILPFFTAAAAVFLAIVFVNFLFFSAADILSFARSIGTQFPNSSSPSVNFILASAMITFMSWNGYVEGGIGPDVSSWYLWPSMLAPMHHHYLQLVLFGNPALWLGGTLAVAFAIAFLWRHFKKSDTEEARISFLLLGGYFAGLFPYFTVVHRSTFLYHYFPALLFSFGILAWMLSQWLKLGTIESLSARQWFFLAMILALVTCGFLVVAPFTYGLS